MVKVIKAKEKIKSKLNKRRREVADF